MQEAEFVRLEQEIRRVQASNTPLQPEYALPSSQS
jgi:hypothetical protein